MTQLAHETLDCRGLSCPMPVVRTKKAMEQLNPGQVLEVLATDKGSLADLKGWTSRTGHQYLGFEEENGVFKHYLRKAAEEREEIRFPHRMDNGELKQALEAGGVRVLDVREAAEVYFGSIPGAISIPYGELEQRWEELDPRETYAVICRTGHRSDYACQWLADKGFAHIYNVLPGMSEWDGPVTERREV